MFWIYPAVIMAIEDEDDRGFMEQMYRRYSVQLVAMTLKSIHDMTAAEEIMSDVFKALVDNIDTLRALTGGQRNN